MSRKLVVFFSLFLMITCVFLYAQNAKEYKPSSITKIIILGSGSLDPDPHRMGPCVAIVVNDKAYIVDAGINCVRQAAALSQEYGGNIAALNPENLDIVFITYLHSDHTLGLPDLMNTSWVVGRDVTS